jgi:hypothetical protein
MSGARRCFSYLSSEARVPLDHPLRPIQKIVDEVPGAPTGEFEKLYAKFGRPSIPPEKLLRTLLLQAFYSVRSERQLMEQLGYNLLFRAVTGCRDVGRDGVHQEPGAPDRRGHRQQVHGGGAEPGAGQGAAVGRSFLGGRHPDRGVGQHEELSPEGWQRRAAGSRPQRGGRPGNHRITLGADKACDVAGFVADLRDYNVTPHVAQNTANRRSAIDGRTTRRPGYAVSGRVRKRIEEVFGWAKSAAGFRKTRHRGLARVGWMFTLTATAYNLIRLPKLVGAAA